MINTKIRLIIGILLISFILILNPIVFGRLITSDGIINSVSLRLLLWGITAALLLILLLIILIPGKIVKHFLLNYKNYILLFLIICLLLIGIEITLRKSSFCARWITYHVDSYEFSYDYSLNSHQFRDNEFVKDKAKNTLRIFLIGDSIVFGAAVKRKDTIDKCLEKRCKEAGINCEAYNMGIPATWATHYHKIAKAFKAYKPDLVVLSLCIDNDIEGTPYKTPLSIRIKQGIMSLKILQFVEQILNKQLGSTKYEQTFPWVKEYAIDDFYKSLCYKGRISPYLVIRGQAVGDNQTYYDSLVTLFEANPTTKEKILAIREIYRDVPFLLLINPSKYQVSTEYFKYMRKLGFIFNEDKVIDGKLQDAIISWAYENKIDYLDILPLMREKPNISFFHNIDAHYNAQANRLVAEGIYNRLEERGLLKQPPVH
jgi:hypothetical protein